MSLKIELFPQKATGTGLDGLRREDFRNVKEAISPLFDALKEDDGDE